MTVFVTDQQTVGSSGPKLRAVSFPIHLNIQNQINEIVKFKSQSILIENPFFFKINSKA